MAVLYDTFVAPFGRLPESCEVTVQSPFVRQNGTATVAPTIARAQVDSTTGEFSVTLPPGPYTVTLRFETTSAAMMRPYSIVIPDDGPHRLTDLLDTQTVWPAPVVGAAQAAAQQAAQSAAQAHAELEAARQAITDAAAEAAEQITANVQEDVAQSQAARDAAIAARDAASGSVTAAATSADAAAASATAANSSKNAAAASATAANNSKTAAATSATNASTSADAAAVSKTDSAASAASAASSASAAQSSADIANTSKSAAATSEDNAASSATAAVGSATNASSSATAAHASELAAAQSAQDAADVVSNGIANATASQTGGIRLPGGQDGELGGTWDHPTVTGWANKADLVGGKIPTAQIPSIATIETEVVNTSAQRLALTTAQVQPGDRAVQLQNPGRGTYFLRDADPSLEASWVLSVAPTDAVTSVNGYSGTVNLQKADLDLANVDNTSDANKPISSATQTALNAKAAASRAITAGTGLQGGGDLTANRTLSANFGSTSGTICEGSDARLANTRTPTDNTVTTAKIVDGAVSAAKLATDAVTTAKVQDGAITSAKIADGTIADADISASASIAPTKLGTGRVLGSNNGTPTSQTLWTGTKAQFDAIGSKDASTVYVVLP